MNRISSKKDSLVLRRSYDKLSYGKNSRFNSKIKEDIEDQQGPVCSYCGNDYSKTATGNIEHFMPKSLFPQFSYTPENLVLACPKCNNSFKGEFNPFKLNSCPVDAYPCTDDFLIVHPLLDDPSVHFSVDTRGLVIAFLTDKAKKSNELFKLNDEGSVSRRARVIVDIDDKLIPLEKRELIESIVSIPRVSSP